jgi:hypothetical protein
MDKYWSAVLESLEDAMVKVRQGMNWKPGDKVRLVFHVKFKYFNRGEVQSVKDVIAKFRDFSIEYAFLHVSDEHPYTLFDTSQRGILAPGTDHAKGQYAPQRGNYLVLGDRDVLISLTGPGGVKRAELEGHANESPNDVNSGDPTNRIGGARVIHLDKNLKLIHQWYGNRGGPGKFDQTHGSAVDPKTGEVWIGDREQYRIVVYTGDGKFIRTIQMRNLICAMYFDPTGQLWAASGQDGQFLKIDRDGNVLGAVGKGSGRETGAFIEASYMAMDKGGHLYSGDTSVGRITEMIPPKK